MYNLGDQFKRDYTVKEADQKVIFRGSKYRITVLSEILVRLEYSETGQFEDHLTELVWNRLFPVPEFTVKEDKNYLEITTKYFRLTYNKEKPFKGTYINSASNLKVVLLSTNKFWYYGHPEVRNYGAPGFSFSSENNNLKFNRALYSIDGFVSLDDINHNIIEESGVIRPREHGPKDVDIYLFMYGNNYDLCLRDYFHLTGHPALLPRFALGNWWMRNVSYNDAQLQKLITSFHEENIPLSVIILGKDWHIRNYNDKTYNSGFTFNNNYFNNPKNLIDYLHFKGIRLGLNINPIEGILPYEKYYEEAIKYIGADKNKIIPFNIFDPRFIDVYFKLLIHPLDDLGVDFFWIDYEDKKDIGTLFILNHYHICDMTRNYKRRPMILSYNTNIAPHRYPVLDSGRTIVSWDTLKRVARHNVNIANLGVSWWSHDIGGYYKGMEDSELYTRFVQLGTFSPILRLNSDEGKYYKREPWRWDISTYAITKDYLQLRHKLIPYLYSEAYRYYKDGTVLLKPLYYIYPDLYDDILYNTEYFFGSQMFIAPITAKKDFVMNRSIHRFFLPDGIWYDFVTGKKFPGNQKYLSFFRDEDYPVFAKAGAIIPLGMNKNLNDTNPPTDMEIHIFPGRSNIYYLYEDDGVSDLYKKGYHLLTTIDYNYLANNYTVIIRAIEGKSGIVPDKRNYKFRFRNTKKANEVIAYFNSTPIETNSYVEGNDFIVEVKGVGTTGQLTINCKGKDIEIDAIRVINDDIEAIINDLPIETELKNKIDEVLFSDKTIQKKRIGIRRLKNKGLESKFVKLFLKLLDYVNQV